MSNNRNPNGVSGGGESVLIQPPKGTPVYDLFKQYEMNHADDKPKPNLLAELKKSLIAKGFTDQSLRSIFPDIKPSGAQRNRDTRRVDSAPNYIVSPIWGIFSAHMRFKDGKARGWLDLKAEHTGFPSAITYVIGLIEKDPPPISDFIEYREQLDIIRETANFLLKDNGANLAIFTKYLAEYATGTEAALIDNPIARYAFRKELDPLVAGLDARLKLADAAIKEKLALAGQCNQKLNEVKALIHATVPSSSKIDNMQNAGDLFLLRQNLEKLESELGHFKAQREQLKFMAPYVQYSSNRVTVICKDQDEFLQGQENALRGIISAAKQKIEARLNSSLVDSKKLIGSPLKSAVALAAEQRIPLTDYKIMLDKAIAQERGMLGSLTAGQNQNSGVAEIKMHQERIKNLVNIQKDKSVNATIGDMSIGEIATRIGLRKQANQLENCTDAKKIKAFVAECQNAFEDTDLHKQLRSVLAVRLTSLNLEIAAIEKVESNLKEQKEKITHAEVNVQALEGRQREVVHVLTAMTNAAPLPQPPKPEAPKTNLLANEEAKQALGAAMHALNQAELSINKYKTEKEGRGSAVGKVEAAGKLITALNSHHEKMNQFHNAGTIHSKDEITEIRKQIATLRSEFNTDHKKAGKSKFKLANVMSKGTVSQDRINTLLEAVDKNLAKLENKLEGNQLATQKEHEAQHDIKPPSKSGRK